MPWCDIAARSVDVIVVKELEQLMEREHIGFRYHFDYFGENDKDYHGIVLRTDLDLEGTGFYSILFRKIAKKLGFSVWNPEPFFNANVSKLTLEDTQLRLMRLMRTGVSSSNVALITDLRVHLDDLFWQQELANI